MFPIINIGPLAIQADGLILLASLFIGVWVMGIFARNLGTAGNKLENDILVGLIAGLISARTGFLLQNFSIFINAPLSLVSLTPSMFNPGFGVLIGILTSLILAQKQKLPFWPSLDSLSPFILLIFMGFHLASYANGSSYGLPTELPWGVELWGQIRHPVQVYILILCAGFLVWLLIQTKGFSRTGFLHSGILFNITLLCLAVFTIFTQTFIAQDRHFGQFNLHQIAGFLVVIISLGSIYGIKFKNNLQRSVIIGIGSNVKPEEHIPSAITRINQSFRIRRKSSIYRTEGVKNAPQETPFWNMVIEIGTKLSFPELREQLKVIEKSYGRQPGEKTHIPIDLDILVYDREVFDIDGKDIPDPDILKYLYITKPIEEMRPDFRHPADGRSLEEILEKITDQTKITNTNEVPDEPEG